MGAWGHGNFENDVAADWVYEIFEPGDHVPYVTQGLEAVAGVADGAALSADACNTALAAADVIAAWLGNPGRDANDTVTVWAKAQASKGAPDPALVATARRVVERVLAGSELLDLWAENEDGGADWKATQADLLQRLG
ncbi:MAG: DUF4259 domain-containing protein [Planctomycetota bacterium]|jgi:hypothetical protein